MKHLTTIKALTVAMFALALVAVPAAYAQAEHAGAEARQKRAEQLRERANEARKTAKERVEAKKAAIQAKLDDKRKEVCERRESKIVSTQQRAEMQAKKHLAVFQKIKERTLTFAEEKNVSVANLQELKAETDAKELAAVGAIEAITATSFDCDSEGTNKELGMTVRQSIIAAHTALKDYRTAVKELILGVKKANGQNREGSTGVETDTSVEDEGAEDTTIEQDAATEGEQ